VADHGPATLAQHATWNELKDELLAVDGDRVPGVVTAGVTRHHFEPFGQNVYDLAFAFIAPLRADDDCCLASFQLAAPYRPQGSVMPAGRADSHTTRHLSGNQ